MTEEQILHLINEALSNTEGVSSHHYIIMIIGLALSYLVGRVGALHKDLKAYRERTLELLEKIYHHITKA